MDSKLHSMIISSILAFTLIAGIPAAFVSVLAQGDGSDTSGGMTGGNMTGGNMTSGGAMTSGGEMPPGGDDKKKDNGDGDDKKKDNGDSEEEDDGDD